MTEYDHGPIRTYEVTWRNRPPEMVQGHQVIFDSTGSFLRPAPSVTPRFHIHGMRPGGHWGLVLTGLEADIITIRDVTDQVEALEAMNSSDSGEAR